VLRVLNAWQRRALRSVRPRLRPGRDGWAYLSRFAALLRKKYKKITIQQGDDLEYLGLQIKKSQGEIRVTQKGFVEKLLAESKVTGQSRIPADSNLFVVDSTSPRLTDAETKVFRSVTMSVSFLAGRTRPDLKTCVSFLSTRCTCATKQDALKLTRLLQYINSTKDMGLVLKPAKTMHLTLYVDASFGTCPETRRSRTGWILFLGDSSYVASRSQMQKCVTRSSCEAELVALDNGLSILLWARKLLTSMGYVQDKPSIILEDNKATIFLLQSKGVVTNERSRHVDIKLFFAHQCTKDELIILVYCATDQNCADFFTKPITTEVLFFRFRTRMLGM
jgi:hypothetical protein